MLISVFLCDSNHGRINTHCGHMRKIRKTVVQMQRLLTQLSNFAGSVLALECREIDHAQGEFQSLDLGLLLDTAFAESRDPFFDADLIDASYTVEVR